MKSEVIIGSRESRLAVIQSEMVKAYIEENNPGLTVSLLTMKTTGDIILDRTLDKVGGKGLFVKELDKALTDGRSDLSVHSLKDMPMACLLWPTQRGRIQGMCLFCLRARLPWRRAWQEGFQSAVQASEESSSLRRCTREPALSLSGGMY